MRGFKKILPIYGRDTVFSRNLRGFLSLDKQGVFVRNLLMHSLSLLVVNFVRHFSQEVTS